MHRATPRFRPRALRRFAPNAPIALVARGQLGLLALLVLFPSPADVTQTLKAGFSDHSFQIGLWTSLKRIGIGYGLSALLGIPLGLLTARIKWLDNTLGSFIVGMQTLPSICWLPAALLWFGLSDAAILFVVIAGSVLAISIGTDDHG
jgi:NitT/TauT family transport system permease protein